ncbi:hypothetical protein BJ165DRAFT_1357042 [Panaeolus papilionaceus]|nr:hypothetical protein BJ165DRAFT_1357042 [Panaeolus papilionaceus]
MAQSLTTYTSQQGDVWFDDRSVILQTNGVQFRVHASILARCSGLFKDLLTLPQPPSANKASNICPPIVQLYDDPEDLKHLLSALIVNLGTVVTPTVPMEFSALSALLRLGEKYDIQHLRDNALLRLRAEFPTSYYCAKSKFTSSSLTYIKEQPGMTFDVIRLAGAEGVFRVLPWAFYCLAYGTTYQSAIIRGTPRRDGTMATLSDDDCDIALRGKGALLKMMTNYTSQWLFCNSTIESSSCTQRVECVGVFTSIRTAICRKQEEDPICPLLDWDTVSRRFYNGNTQLCSWCKKVAIDRHEDLRRKAWSALPYVFGQSSWTAAARREII